MNEKAVLCASKLIPLTYVNQGLQAIRIRENAIRILLEQRKLPAVGWDEQTIEMFLQHLSMMDSNNFPGNCGVGEREARFASGLVAKRHYRMGHGIGRSGDVTETQPKAAGSSLLNKLTNSMLLDLIHAVGCREVTSCFLVPMATGMTLTLCMLTLRLRRPSALFVIWPRIDQKSCFKSIITAGFKPVVVEEILVGDELRTNVEEIERQIYSLGAENVLCVLSTTSCFAPRAPDSVVEIATLCKQHDIPHIVNNAYGLQSSKCMHLIKQGFKSGRVDAFVQSTDKNLMVPVGGSVVAGFDPEFISSIGSAYPGRASGTPSMDVFITLLTLGIEGYRALLTNRKKVFSYLRDNLERVAVKHGERILCTPNNPISIAVSVCSSCRNSEKVTMLGSMLFTKCVSGTRVVPVDSTKEVGGHRFCGFGSHCNSYTCAYMTAAAVVGTTTDDVDLLVRRLDKVLGQWKVKSTEQVSINNADVFGCDVSDDHSSQ